MTLASRSAVADKPRCRVGKLWPKYKWKTNIVDASKQEALIFYTISKYQ